jgi:hypothetical protein
VHPDIQIVALGKRRADVLLVLVPKCEPCGGKLKFTFNNGAAQSELRSSQILAGTNGGGIPSSSCPPILSRSSPSKKRLMGCGGGSFCP